MPERPFTEYAARNTAPILEVLRHEFAGVRDVLEIGSGTGQHAVALAGAMPHLSWQTSELPEHHASVNAWIDSVDLANVLRPLDLDVRRASLPAESRDAVFSANTAHIMSIDTVRTMFMLVGGVLRRGGRFCLYGPFRQSGMFNATSNAEFHVSLRARDPDMGIRHLEALDEFARDASLARARMYAMPANNHLVVWHKAGEEA